MTKTIPIIDFLPRIIREVVENPPTLEDLMNNKKLLLDLAITHPIVSKRIFEQICLGDKQPSIRCAADVRHRLLVIR